MDGTGLSGNELLVSFCVQDILLAGSSGTRLGLILSIGLIGNGARLSHYFHGARLCLTTSMDHCLGTVLTVFYVVIK